MRHTLLHECETPRIIDLRNRGVHWFAQRYSISSLLARFLLCSRYRTYFGISSLPGRWREGGLKVAEAVGCAVLRGKVCTTGGSHRLATGLTEAAGAGAGEAAGAELSEESEGEEEEEEEVGGWQERDNPAPTSGTLMAGAGDCGLLSTRLIGTILSLGNVCKNKVCFNCHFFSVRCRILKCFVCWPCDICTNITLCFF